MTLHLMLSPLAGPGREVLALKLHSLQGALSEEERLSMVDRVLSSVVAQVGLTKHVTCPAAVQETEGM